MRLYHYLEARWTLDNIRRRRLKVSYIDDMNDPYEARSVGSSDPVSQVALEKTKMQVLEKYGALCFSKSWNSILMWGHYGEKHKGICLGFDVPNERTRPVEYESKVLTVGNLLTETRADFDFDQGVEIERYMMGVKHKGWSYEEEVRVHSPLKEKEEETGKYFENFGDAWF